MDEKDIFNHKLSTVAWGVLFIWWGVVVMIDPLTIGIGAAGTGLIFLGVNAVRLIKGFPMKSENNTLGIIAVVWGSLDHARYLLGLPSGLSFALLLVVIGLVFVVIPLVSRPNLNVEDNPDNI